MAAVGRAFGICDRTARKWVDRAVRGELADRSCRPQRSPRAIAPAVMVEIQRLRQLGWTGAQIAEVVQVSRATVAHTLRQLAWPAWSTTAILAAAGAISGRAARHAKRLRLCKSGCRMS